jgi:hypothetical protein
LTREWQIHALAELRQLAGRSARRSPGRGAPPSCSFALSLAPLADVGLSDSGWLRLVLLVLFVVAAIGWVRLLLGMADDLRAVTRVEYEMRRKEQKEATARGEPYVMSGDPDQLHANAYPDRLMAHLGAMAKSRDMEPPHLSRYKKWRARRRHRRRRRQPIL